MPTYVYETIREDGTPGERFEVRQKMSDPVIEKHPETGEAVRRVLTPTAVHRAGGGSDATFSAPSAGGCGTACGCHGGMKN
jgi:predicted nucleic acid-binding Zn ribbon protein